MSVLGKPSLHLVDSPAKEETAGLSTEVQLACPVTLQRYENGKLSFRDSMVAVESDLRVKVNGEDCAVLTRTPGDDLSLVIGHLFTRSMIRESADVADCSFSYRNIARAEVRLKTMEPMRRVYPSPKPVHVAPDLILELKERFERRQNLYKNTQSTHAAALFSMDGELVAFGEDVGRHNAFDKALGRALLEGTLTHVAIAMLSSRLALELVVKASAADIPILCGFSAATSSSIHFAEKNDITLVGRVREDAFNLYASGWRIRAPRG